jgi:hypothetical protein
MATIPHTKPDEQQLEIFRLRNEVERLTRVAQGNFDANTHTLKWTLARINKMEKALRLIAGGVEPYCEGRCAEVANAALDEEK